MTALGMFVACAATLAACVEPPVVTVFNNTQGPIVLKLDPDSMFGRRFRTLQPGDHVRVVLGTMLPPGAQISTANCDVGYDWKINPASYFAERRDDTPSVKIQIDPDLTLILLPADATGIMPAASIESFEKANGFPVKPLFKRCR
jgi:hypothetical protein